MDSHSNDADRGGDRRQLPQCLMGRDWAARITAEALPAAAAGGGGGGAGSTEEEGGGPPQAVSLILYVASEDGRPVVLDPDAVRAALGGAAAAPPGGRAFSGEEAAPVGRWGMYLSGGGGGVAVNHLSLRAPALHTLAQTVQAALLGSVRAQHAAGARALALTLPDTAEEGATFAAVQVTAQLPLTLDLAFLGGVVAGPRRPGSPADAAEAWAVGELSGARLGQRLRRGESEFERHFEVTFGNLTAPSLPAGAPRQPAAARAEGAAACRRCVGRRLPPAHFDPSIPCRSHITHISLRPASCRAGTAEAARAAVSNLLGGIGYWHGHSLVKPPSAPPGQAAAAPLALADAPLLSATPSRSFFPRGFLWDEGFHQLLVRRWSGPLSRDALAHWFGVMTAGGWIPREQILGAEAASRVPAEFVLQSPDAANPPTLFLALSDMARQAAAAAAAWRGEAPPPPPPPPADGGGAEASPLAGWVAPDAGNDLDFLKAAWPRLRAWFLWYNATQAGPVPGSYRWRGRDPGAVRELNPKTLTSGLDDFPRASHPSPIERHVDLRCWMALAARAMATVGAAVDAPAAEVAAFNATAARLEDFEELMALHWDEEAHQFRDWGNHTEDVELRAAGGRPGVDPERALIEGGEPPRPRFVPHFGYPSLMPLIMGLIPHDSALLRQQIAALRDGAHLWTPHGLRSLSRASSLYRRHNTPHDPPYWRGAIWVNVNHLALRSLQRYAAGGGPHAGAARSAAAALRAALLRTVVGEYRRSGYLWEQYDDEGGRGKGSHPFTGWTALVALAASDKAPQGDAWADVEFEV
jgi:mannosyl-oligosaccharide glucosidase